MRRRWILPWFLTAGLSLVLVLARDLGLYQGAPALALESGSMLPAAVPVGTAFTYQGHLEKDGQPVDGTCDTSFTLHDSSVEGLQVGAAIVSPVSIVDGLFTVRLDFGAGAFAGDARWLGIQIRCPGDPGYTDLGRQELTAAPYAVYARAAPWAGLTGVPAGLADNIDGIEYGNVIVVAKTGGDFASIQEALNSIVAAGEDNRYLVWVAPGTYHEVVWMVPYVDIQGAGQGLTTISSSTCGTATVNGADSAELRRLTVEQTVAAGCADAWAISNDNASAHIAQVTANASGATHNFGVRNQYGSPVMSDVTASATGTSQGNWGIYNYHASASMVNVTASAEGGQGNVGVGNHSSSATMTNVTASASGGLGPNDGLYNESSTVTVTGGTILASGAAESQGVLNSNSTVTFEGVTVRASDASDMNHGMRTFGSSLITRNSLIVATGDDASEECGMYHFAPTGSYRSTIDHSQIVADLTIKYDGGYTVLIGASQLAGGSTGGDGTLVCAGAYDENYAFYAGPACP